MQKPLEERLLGMVLQREDRAHKVAELLHPSQFQEPKNRIVFQTMLTIVQSKNELNEVTLMHALNITKIEDGEIKSDNALEYVGGSSYIMLLAVGVPDFQEAFEDALAEMAKRPSLEDKKQEEEKEPEPEEEWPEYVE